MKIENRIKEWAEKGESETLELKSNMPSNPMLIKIIYSLINTNGGEIIIGLNEDGSFSKHSLSNNILMGKNNTCKIKGINGQGDYLKKYTKIEIYSSTNYNLIIITVKKSRTPFKKRARDGNIY